MKTIVFIFEFLLFVFLYFIFFFAMSMSFIEICSVFKLPDTLLTILVYLSIFLSFLIVLLVYKLRENRIKQRLLDKPKLNSKKNKAKITRIVPSEKQDVKTDIIVIKESPKIERNNERNIDL